MFTPVFSDTYCNPLDNILKCRFDAHVLFLSMMKTVVLLNMFVETLF